MLELHPNVLEKNGRKEFVVLPYEEFMALQQLLEDLQDLNDLRDAKAVDEHQQGMTLDNVKKQFEIAK